MGMESLLSSFKRKRDVLISYRFRDVRWYIQMGFLWHRFCIVDLPNCFLGNFVRCLEYFTSGGILRVVEFEIYLLCLVTLDPDHDSACVSYLTKHRTSCTSYS